MGTISTHAPAGGATPSRRSGPASRPSFLLTPLREGRRFSSGATPRASYFYSRPCGRGDGGHHLDGVVALISTHAPAGGATQREWSPRIDEPIFLLTPLREGRPFLG